MTELAKLIEIESVLTDDIYATANRKVGTMARFSLKIDGEEFPYYLAEGSVGLNVSGGQTMPGVTITIMANEVRVLDSVGRQIPDDA